MTPKHTPQKPSARFKQQRGLVLFFALIALVVMSLAAVALIRSVDTNTLIAGNLAFKNSASNSGDAGIEAAVAWLKTQQATDTSDPLIVGTHPFNSNHSGYYASFADKPTDAGYVDLKANSTWSNSPTPIVDNSGNKSSYIIQRMCRSYTANVVPATDSCLTGSASGNYGSNAVTRSDEYCKGCGSSGAPPAMMRVTVKVTGIKDTVSYLQAFVF